MRCKSDNEMQGFVILKIVKVIGTRKMIRDKSYLSHFIINLQLSMVFRWSSCNA